MGVLFSVYALCACVRVCVCVCMCVRACVCVCACMRACPSRPLTASVRCVPQVKVMTDTELLGYACEQFLGKSVSEIKSVILQTLEGHLRSILGEETALTTTTTTTN